MSLYVRLSAAINGGGGGSGGDVHWKAPVANFATLPLLGNSISDARVTDDTNDIYIWTGAAWILDTAEASFPLVSPTANAASAGALRLANAELVAWRDSGNTANGSIKLNASNAMEFTGSFGGSAQSMGTWGPTPYAGSSEISVTGGSSLIKASVLLTHNGFANSANPYLSGLQLGHNTDAIRWNYPSTASVTLAAPYTDGGIYLGYSGAAYLSCDNALYAANFFARGDIFSSHATAGHIRLQNNDSISWRNAANSANLSLKLDASNRLTSEATTVVNPDKSLIADFGNGLSTNSIVDGIAPLAVFDSTVSDAGVYFFAKNPRLTLSSFSGTYASPGYKAVNSGMGVLHNTTWNGTDAYSRETGRIQFRATETHSVTAAGTSIRFSVTPDTTTSMATAVTINSDKSLRAEGYIQSGASIQAPDGAAATPSFNFSDSTGFYRIPGGGGSDGVGITISGSDFLRIHTGGAYNGIYDAVTANNYIKFNNSGNRMQISSDTVLVLGADGNGPVSIGTNSIIVSNALITSASSHTLTADNEVLSVTGKAFILLSSDDATPANRTFTLANGQIGQLLTLVWDDAADGAELLTGTGNVKLSAAWTMTGATAYATLNLIYSNGGFWCEISRSTNI